MHRPLRPVHQRRRPGLRAVPHRSLVLASPFLLDASDQVVQIPDHPVKQLVHQLRLHHFRNVGDNPFPGTGHPAGLRVGTPSARQDQHAGVRPFQRLQVGRELPFRLRMAQSRGILLEAPTRGVFVNVRPAESGE